MLIYNWDLVRFAERFWGMLKQPHITEVILPPLQAPCGSAAWASCVFMAFTSSDRCTPRERKDRQCRKKYPAL